jgi:LmbE family N-acetylglucosaminyl deacetylase
VKTNGLFSKQRCLVLAPHPDDETFGCAGTIARLKAEGSKVYVIAVSAGDVHHYNVKKYSYVTGRTRQKEFEAAMKVLGVDDYELAYNDSEVHLKLDAMPLKELINLFEKDCRLSMDKIKPTLVILPAISYNQDHEAVFRAGFTACRPHMPDVKPFQKIVLSCEYPALSWSLEREKFHPNLYVDISAYLPQKLKALRCYRSQVRTKIHHCSSENVEWIARVRGREVSVDAAEAFMVHRFLL